MHLLLGLVSFLKHHQLCLHSWVSSKSNHLSEGNLEKQNLSQIRAWLTKFYGRKCFQTQNLKKWSKVFKDWIQLVQFINLGLCPRQGQAQRKWHMWNLIFLNTWSLRRYVLTWLAAEPFIFGASTYYLAQGLSTSRLSKTEMCLGMWDFQY